MKKLIQLVSALLVLTICPTGTSRAAEAEDPGQATVTNTSLAGSNVSGSGTVTNPRGGRTITIDASLDNPYKLPPEVWDKLSSDQIMELQKTRYNRSQVEDVVVPLASFAAMAVIVGLIFSYRFKRDRMVQETIRLMVDKGAPIPPELLLPRQAQRRPKSDLRSGLAWCGMGVALLIYLSAVPVNRLWALGLIPLLIGVAYLVAWKVEQKKVQ